MGDFSSERAAEVNPVRQHAKRKNRNARLCMGYSLKEGGENWCFDQPLVLRMIASWCHFVFWTVGMAFSDDFEAAVP